MTRRTLADVRKLSAEMEPRYLQAWVQTWSDGSAWRQVLGDVRRHLDQAKSSSGWPRQPDFVYLLELDRLPLVWTPEDVARVMRQPKIDCDSEDEYEVAERMAVLWMQYCQEMKR